MPSTASRPHVIAAPAIRGGAASGPGVVAHAGLAARRPGGVPTFDSLGLAVRMQVDAVELDVCASADAQLVLHHDTRDLQGRPLHATTLAQLRRRIPELLTLDDAAHILRDTRIVVDLKTPHAVAPLARWLRGRHHGAVAVCSDSPDALRRVGAAAPDVLRWQTFPQIGTRKHERVMRVLTSLLAHRAGHSRHLATGLVDTALRFRRQPRSALAHITGLPWRALVPQALIAVRHELGANGISAHHSLVTHDLCRMAHALGLTVTAWTVNDATAAAHMRQCGANLITTDDVVSVRAGLGLV